MQILQFKKVSHPNSLPPFKKKFTTAEQKKHVLESFLETKVRTILRRSYQYTRIKSDAELK